MKLKLAFSTCPNDTFMFDAMVNKRIDTEGLSFSVEMADIANLNQMAQDATFDIIKVSYASYQNISSEYQILNAGSALGYANGPLLVTRLNFYPNDISELNIAIPGVNTTANLLLNMAFPVVKAKTECIFSDIEEMVLTNQVDAGLLIHENRFTFDERGLKKIIDLGEWWEKLYNLPIPLGGIMVKRSLSDKHKNKINAVLQKSVAFAMENPNESMPYVRQYAQSMKDDVMKKHIELYVNNFSKDLGEKGREAIEKLLENTSKINENQTLTYPIFAI